VLAVATEPAQWGVVQIPVAAAALTAALDSRQA
jgi:hypothetical protein